MSFVEARDAKKSKKSEREDTKVRSHKDIEGFEQWVDFEDAEALASDSYKDITGVGDVVNGWTIIESYDNKESGFKAKLYEKNGNYVFATAGTNPLSGKDWINNVRQQFGKAGQYEESVKIAKHLAEKYKNLIFVGHSLGGGLASANSRATGHNAITFNSSALSDFYKKGKESKIAAYISDGDVLDYVNEVLLRQKVEGEIIKREVSHSNLPNLQGIPLTGLYQLLRGIKIHTDY